MGESVIYYIAKPLIHPIICSGGSGGKNLDETSGQMEHDKTVRTLLKAHKTRKPIALLSDDLYALFPYQFDPKWMYVVLGFYQVVDAWGENLPHRIFSSLT